VAPVSASIRQVWDDPIYELIESISAGALGPLSLGRLLGLRNASRLVTLRQLPPETDRALAKAIDLATSIGHPRLLTTLGIAKIEGTAYLASEYVEGLPLLELTRLFEAAEASLPQDIAVRLTLDVLGVVSGVRKELARNGEVALGRCLYPDTVWITAAAEVMLAEVPVAFALARSFSTPPRRDWSPPEEVAGVGSDERSDVFAAGALFYELLCGRALETKTIAAARRALSPSVGLGKPLAQPLLDIIERALTDDPTKRFESAQAMSDALLALPEHWIATSAELRTAVSPLTRPSINLDAAMYPESGEHAIDPWESPTRSLRQRF
jgi:serine/threonine protein kinase